LEGGAFGNFLSTAQNGTKRAQNNETISDLIGLSGGADPFRVSLNNLEGGAAQNFFLTAQNGTKRAQNNKTILEQIGSSGGATMSPAPPQHFLLYLDGGSSTKFSFISTKQHKTSTNR